MKFPVFGKLEVRWLMLFTVALASTISTVVLYSFLPTLQNNETSSPTSSDISIPINAVAAEGYLEPQGEVIRLSAPDSAQTPNPRIEKLLVKLGDRLNKGQVIAILDSRDRLEAALTKAQKQVLVAQANLAKVKAGAKQGEINADKARIENIQAEKSGQNALQQATIERLEAELHGEQEAQKATIALLKAELQNATTDCSRYQQLYQAGAIADRERDSKCLIQNTTQKRLQEAQANLNRIVTSRKKQIAEAKANLKRTVKTLEKQQVEAKANLEQTKEVRPVDIAVAEAELENAKAVLQQAQVELNLAYVRSPTSGQILKIHTRLGEKVSDKGIVAIGKTQQMYVKAEIYETDVSRVRVDQRATITSNGFPEKLHGTVDEIGLEIGKRDVLSTDPVADVDARVVEVKIRLDPQDSQKVAHLTNLRVKSIINTTPNPKHTTSVNHQQ
ncbi:MAG: ABC exporter membrane fusion protein [Scytonema sp. PMC 1069.18]|nr:ABC exporter membrane fusion protein [Scytonema sp. PMC 1069.18]MEC4884833.1 ABC exporter membrane fusion protein [Scytonema sp. PMC 1070.18]